MKLGWKINYVIFKRETNPIQQQHSATSVSRVKYLDNSIMSDVYKSYFSHMLNVQELKVTTVSYMKDK